MIAKSFAALALIAQIAQIAASGCSCTQSAILVPTCESTPQSSPIVLLSAGSSPSSFAGSSTLTRNILAKGRYPVALSNCGPTPDQQIPLTTSRLTAPLQERPTVRLPAAIPPPRTLAHSCTCYKTILRPRVHDQYITVPTIQRYVETNHKPVIENIQYEALPVNCDRYSSGVRFLEVGAGSSAGFKLLPVNPGCSCGCQTLQRVDVPRVQVVEAVQVPEIQTMQIPQSFGCTTQC